MANCAPKTPPTGCLDVTIQESIILPNFNVQESFNKFTVCGINNYVTRTDVIQHDWSGSGIGIIDFVGSEQEQTPGSFVNANVGEFLRLIVAVPVKSKDASLGSPVTKVVFELFISVDLANVVLALAYSCCKLTIMLFSYTLKLPVPLLSTHNLSF